MRTTKPISTISFNTKEHLALKLNELVKAKKVSFWAFIEHQPEDDEVKNKVHYHVYVEPSALIQTDDLREYLKEYDAENPDKPKGCLTWDSSNFGNWYMYVLHDKRYLASKGQTRKYHYKHEQMKTSDEDDLTRKAKCIDLLALSPYADMLDAMEHGVNWPEYFARGTVPLPQVRNFKLAWDMLMMNVTFRNGREGHPSDVED